jgi:hypothetical protein
MTIFLPSNVIILSSCGLVTGRPALSFETGGPMKFIGVLQILLGKDYLAGHHRDGGTLATQNATFRCVEPLPQSGKA